MFDRLLILAVLLISVPAYARQSSVTPSLVCIVQHAIRFREAAWPAAICERVATALNATPSPRTTLSIAVLESDLRPRVVATTRPGVHDVGLLGVRCVTLPSGGACLFGPARGYTVEELKDLEINVRVAAEIMRQKKSTHGRHWLRAYNGGHARTRVRSESHSDRKFACRKASGGEES